MAKGRLTVANDGIELETSAAISILNTLLRAGVRIDHRCGGRAQCGTCRCRILNGADNLSPIRKRERAKLDKFPNNEDLRLACQTHAVGDVTIEIQSRNTKALGGGVTLRRIAHREGCRIVAGSSPYKFCEWINDLYTGNLFTGIHIFAIESCRTRLDRRSHDHGIPKRLRERHR